MTHRAPDVPAGRPVRVYAYTVPARLPGLWRPVAHTEGHPATIGRSTWRTRALRIATTAATRAVEERNTDAGRTAYVVVTPE